MRRVVVYIDNLAENPQQPGLSPAQQEALQLGARLGEPSVVTPTDPATTAALLDFTEISQLITPTTALKGSDPAVVDLLADAALRLHPEVILGVHTVDSANALARVAARLDAGLITQAVSVSQELEVSKSVLAGSYLTTAAALPHPADTPAPGTAATPLVITLKPQAGLEALTPAATTQEQPELHTVELTASAEWLGLRSTELTVSARPALTEAATVVAFGRGVAGDLSLIEQLADELNAGIGATRAATDAGWIDHSAQVGQTGVTVSPQLYISVGISGAIQQRTGMQTSGTIIAINKDEDAPVFEIADFGIIGDLTEVLPQVIAELRQRAGG